MNNAARRCVIDAKSRRAKGVAPYNMKPTVKNMFLFHSANPT